MPSKEGNNGFIKIHVGTTSIYKQFPIYVIVFLLLCRLYLWNRPLFQTLGKLFRHRLHKRLLSAFCVTETSEGLHSKGFSRLIIKNFPFYLNHLHYRFISIIIVAVLSQSSSLTFYLNHHHCHFISIIIIAVSWQFWSNMIGQLLWESLGGI